MPYDLYYQIMPDGTVKQINPFTGTEVWSVTGRGSKPLSNEIPPTAKVLEKKDALDYCSFCPMRYFEVPPEKARLVKTNGEYQVLKFLTAERYFETDAEFRRVPNLFEIVTLDYWRKNYNFRIPDERKKWRDEYLSTPDGIKHIEKLLNYKLRQTGKTDEQIRRMHGFDKLSIADAFFGGSHELIIAKPHYKQGAEWDVELFSSGDMTPNEHYHYFKFSIDAMKDIFDNNRYARYISIFQNWLRPAGASMDHLHKQLVALDEWGSSIQSQIKLLREDPNAFNEMGANFAARHNLIIAENDYALAFVGIGHRFPTIEIFSRSQTCRPYEHSDEEIRGLSNLIHAFHVAMGSGISCNEEWYYTPVDAVYKMPWHILIKWRVNVPAGFEGGTSIYLSPITPIELRDKLVPKLYQVREEGKIESIRIAEECRIFPNPLKYYLR
jgi:galactose-1-phosphate uridylyltransferase